MNYFVRFQRFLAIFELTLTWFWPPKWPKIPIFPSSSFGWLRNEFSPITRRIFDHFWPIFGHFSSKIASFWPQNMATNSNFWPKIQKSTKIEWCTCTEMFRIIFARKILHLLDVIYFIITSGTCNFIILYKISADLQMNFVIIFGSIVR